MRIKVVFNGPTFLHSDRCERLLGHPLRHRLGTDSILLLPTTIKYNLLRAFQKFNVFFHRGSENEIRQIDICISSGLTIQTRQNSLHFEC